MLSPAQVEQNKREIIQLLKKSGREDIDKLIAWLETTDFFAAPASTKMSFHGTYEGGLAHHSLNVYYLFKEKVKKLNLDVQDDEVIIAALCHDFCKIDFYKPNLLKDGTLSDTKPYVVEDKFPFGHGEKSALLAQRHIDLTQKEALLIRWHIGPYDAEWENYEQKVREMCPAIDAFCYADGESARYLEGSTTGKKGRK
jgi:hypothetical protein